MNDIAFLIQNGKMKPRRRYSKYRDIYEKIDAELREGETLMIENIESITKALSLIAGIRQQYDNMEIHLDKNKGEDGFDQPYIMLNWR